MVESTPFPEGGSMQLVTQNGIVLQPNSPLRSPTRPVQWALSPTDLDVNYIAHFARLS